jgi:hypothetical protein
MSTSHTRVERGGTARVSVREAKAAGGAVDAGRVRRTEILPTLQQPWP